MKFILIMIVLCAWQAAAALLTTDGSVADTQSKINSASNGDTVQLPDSGAFTWASGITIPGTKWITFDGNNSTITRGATSADLIALTTHATGHQRVTNYKATQTTSGDTAPNLLSINGSFSNARFRVDHCVFTGTGSGCTLVEINQSYGLFDHCNFNAPGNSEHVHNLAYGAGDDTGWHDVVTPGTINQICFEDCNWTNNATFGNPANFLGNSAIQGYYGCRTTVRHCNFSMSQIDMHGGDLGARWWEVYSNGWFCVANANQDRYIAMRSGSGVIFYNTKGGSANAGSGDIDMALEAGDSSTYHPGLGKDLALEPMYVWGNDGTMTVTFDSTVTNGVNLFLLAKTNYTALAYPHPDIGGSGLATMSAVNVNVGTLKGP